MNKQTCKNCFYYYEFYTKSYDCFNKTRYGICNKQHNQVKNGDSCELWKDDEIKKESRQKVCLKTLEICIKYINEIAQILREND